jgi:predicted RNA binding protein YcfA (HicA-like mRNA interferase family)
MTRLANISGAQAVKIFGKFGYQIARQTGSHIILQHPEKAPLVIPNHQEVAPALLRTQIIRAGLTVEEFMECK